MGEVNGDRMLIELRMTEESQWYLDAFIKSGDSSKALIDKSLLHPAGNGITLRLLSMMARWTPTSQASKNWRERSSSLRSSVAEPRLARA